MSCVNVEPESAQNDCFAISDIHEWIHKNEFCRNMRINVLVDTQSILLWDARRRFTALGIVKSITATQQARDTEFEVFFYASEQLQKDIDIINLIGFSLGTIKELKLCLMATSSWVALGYDLSLFSSKLSYESSFAAERTIVLGPRKGSFPGAFTEITFIVNSSEGMVICCVFMHLGSPLSLVFILPSSGFRLLRCSDLHIKHVMLIQLKVLQAYEACNQLEWRKMTYPLEGKPFWGFAFVVDSFRAKDLESALNSWGLLNRRQVDVERFPGFAEAKQLLRTRSPPHYHCTKEQFCQTPGCVWKLGPDELPARAQDIYEFIRYPKRQREHPFWGRLSGYPKSLRLFLLYLYQKSSSEENTQEEMNLLFRDFLCRGRGLETFSFFFKDDTVLSLLSSRVHGGKPLHFGIAKYEPSAKLLLMPPRWLDWLQVRWLMPMPLLSLLLERFGNSANNNLYAFINYTQYPPWCLPFNQDCVELPFQLCRRFPPNNLKVEINRQHDVDWIAKMKIGSSSWTSYLCLPARKNLTDTVSNIHDQSFVQVFSDEAAQILMDTASRWPFNQWTCVKPDYRECGTWLEETALAFHRELVHANITQHLEFAIRLRDRFLMQALFLLASIPAETGVSIDIIRNKSWIMLTENTIRQVYVKDISDLSLGYESSMENLKKAVVLTNIDERLARASAIYVTAKLQLTLAEKGSFFLFYGAETQDPPLTRDFDEMPETANPCIVEFLNGLPVSGCSRELSILNLMFHAWRLICGNMRLKEFAWGLLGVRQHDDELWPKIQAILETEETLPFDRRLTQFRRLRPSRRKFTSLHWIRRCRMFGVRPLKCAYQTIRVGSFE